MYKKIKPYKQFIKSSFLKRFFIIFVCIVIAFNTVCKPKDTNAEVLMTIATIVAIVAGVSGIVFDTGDVLGWFDDNKGMDEDAVVDYFNKNVSVDGDGNYTFTDDAQLTINQMLEDYNDKVTMIYRYPVRPDQLDAEWFSSKSGYDALVAAISDHPELYFYIAGTTNSHNIIDFYVFSSDELACVNSNEDLIYANCALYNSEWNQDFNVYHCRVVDGASSFQCVGANPSNIKTFDTFDELLACDWNYDTSVASVTLMRSDDIKWDITQAKWLVTAKPGALNCYKSANDMKKDLADQVVGTYTPDYTGIPNYNITTSEVNNIVNNYYSGSSGDNSGGSSGSDDSGGSSGILDGIGKVFGAIGKVFDTVIGFVLDIVAKLIEGISKILDSFANVFTRLIDLVPSGFNDFLTAMFPYVPEEWVSLVSAMITIFALGAIFWFFKGR